jgi:ADP-heptose:LPS heptosyltransferase
VVAGDPHLVDATLELLGPLGLDRPPVRFDLPLREAAGERMSNYLREALLTKGFVVVNCGASCAARLWSPGRYGRVARHLGEQYGLPSVVTWAGPKESELASRIVAKAGGHALKAPDTTLAELAVLQRRAVMVIGSDTGPLHLAAAVGAPCVGLYGPTRASRSGPYGSQHVVVEVPDPPQHRGRRRRLDDTAMRRITVDAVCQACDELLSRAAVADSKRFDAA